MDRRRLLLLGDDGRMERMLRRRLRQMYLTCEDNALDGIVRLSETRFTTVLLNAGRLEQQTAEAVKALRRVGPRKDLTAIAERVREHGVSTVVLGLPLLLSGEEGRKAGEAREMAKQAILKAEETDGKAIGFYRKYARDEVYRCLDQTNFLRMGKNAPMILQTKSFWANHPLNTVSLIAKDLKAFGAQDNGQTRSKIETNPANLVDSVIEPDEIHLYESNNHHQNFLSCVKSRKQPIAHAEIGHRSATVCHLGNIAILLQRKLQWDPAREQFINDDVANRMLSRPMRNGWHL